MHTRQVLDYTNRVLHNAIVQFIFQLFKPFLSAVNYFLFVILKRNTF